MNAMIERKQCPQETDVFVDKRCHKTCKDFGFCCHDCSLHDLILVCGHCFDKSKHCGHEVQTVVLETAIACDCGNDSVMKSHGFCDRHSAQNGNGLQRTRSLKSTGSAKTRKISANGRRESEGFFDGILHHLFAVKTLDLPEFYDLNKVSKYSLDGILLTKLFHRSKAHYLEDELRLKAVFEVNRLTTRFGNSSADNKKRMLLWYSMDKKKDNEKLAKVLTHGIGYENGKIGRALYFRDRIKRFIKYEDKDFGLLLLCEVVIGNSYRIFESKHFREVPKGFDSIKCMGKYSPEKTKAKTLGAGILVPTGKTVVDEDVENKTSFDINQFVVFDKSQVIVRYCVQYYEQK